MRLSDLIITPYRQKNVKKAFDKAQALLAYLAVEADRPHRRDALASLLWPEQPQRKARHNLRQAISFLHQAIHGRDDDSGGRRS